MVTREFERLVAEVLDELPAWVQRRIKNVAVIVAEEPDEEIRKENCLRPDETLLGFYQGVPRTARGVDYGVGPTLPDTIIIFQKPIEEEAGNNPEDIKKVIRETIWHEFAHYFGMDENGVINWENSRRERRIIKRQDKRN
jgi:predicted Zn-dependent protease with MMP-like domain